MSADSVKYIEKNRGRASLSVLLIVSVLALTGVFFITRNNTANAAAITNASDTLNNSAPTATSNNAIVFTTPTGVTAGQTITVTFPSGFSTSTGLNFADMDLSGDTNGEQTLADVASASTWGATTSGDVVITFTSVDATFTAGEVITIEIGDNATAGGIGDSYITNPTKVLAAGIADVYPISIGGTFADSGDVLVAIIDSVAVSVTIDESLSFTISPVTAGDCDTKFGTLDGPGTTSTTVPFGTLTGANTFNHACQDISVSTNASSGYVLTNQTDQSLQSGSILINNGSCTGSSCTETIAGAWGTNTDNGFGYTCDGVDCSINATSSYKTFACLGATTTECLPGGGESAQDFASSTGAVSNSTTTIQYKLSFSGTQEAGTYTNTVTYILTPTF